MTDRQIKALMHYLYDQRDHSLYPQNFYKYSLYSDHMWREGNSGWPAPEWLENTLADWRSAFRNQDWAELVEWMPADDMGQYSKLRARNRHWRVVMETRALCDDIKNRKRCSKTKAIEAVAETLGREPKTVSEQLARLRTWEQKSKLFWTDFLVRNR
jgi:hypothetical protein